MSLRPSSIRMVVVLPAPFGPSSPKISPRATANEMPLTTVVAAVALGEIADLDDVFAHRRPNLATAPTITRSAMPMRPAPMMPHSVEVVTATRKVCEADSPRAAARTVVT